jgi:chromatin segregation and condensation protein Rec8/ScpA/Scc1 (kleisin family)
MIVVTFIAILELMRMEQILIRQEEQFGEIWIHRRNAEQPESEQVPKEEINTIEQKEIKE